EWRLSPSGPLAQPAAIGFKKKTTRIMFPVRFPKSPRDKRFFRDLDDSMYILVFISPLPIERLDHAAVFKRHGPRRTTDAG
ncbi:MAG: hypothetical protein WBG11_00980, partial [Methylocella sp.]